MYVVFNTDRLTLDTVGARDTTDDDVTAVVMFNASYTSSTYMLHNTPRGMVPCVLAGRVATDPPIATDVAVTVKPTDYDTATSAQLDRGDSYRICRSLVGPFDKKVTSVTERPVERTTTIRNVHFTDTPVFSVS